MDLFSGDAITLTGVTVHAHHGVFEHERKDGQTFVVDATLALDLSPAAAGDDLERTVDYARVAQTIADEVTRDPVDLIETVAERVASQLLASEPIHAVRVTVHKPDAPMPVETKGVAVTVVRVREEGAK